MLKARNVSRADKIRIYETIIRPVVLYAYETWTTIRASENKLDIWEQKVLRKIFGGVRDRHGQWRRRTNTEVKTLYGKPIITNKIKAQRSRWLGHIIRMPDDRVVKRVLHEGVGAKKRRGRPKERWYQQVTEDIEKIGTSDWRDRAKDRRKWREVDAILSSADSWDDIPARTIQRSGNKLYPVAVEDIVKETEGSASQESPTLLNIIQDFDAFQNVDKENIEEWLSSDKHQPGYEIKDDDTIAYEALESDQLSDNTDVSDREEPRKSLA
ncbi:hypothetical protein MML48_3g00011100 [Holotrichia oblita]|uniref:Uncharacterized protein n=1 Tax=Holotrichia oblita TaxID=644536 RepID=A0ACB9THC0_HOLOL|nr:hypothetical protein MML48_3g00011100 [Holotrichia oblita]